MKETINKLQEWLKTLEAFSLPTWNKLPDLDLYMDQVVTYLERELSPLMVEDQEKIITTWMINNYVKGDLIPNPVKKKYSKEHLGYMIAICSMKQILSISDIGHILNLYKTTNQDQKLTYDSFQSSSSKAINAIANQTLSTIKPYLDKDINEETNQSLVELAANLAIEAEVKKIIANKILYLLRNLDELQRQEYERIEKDKQNLEKLEKEKQELIEKSKANKKG